MVKKQGKEAAYLLSDSLSSQLNIRTIKEGNGLISGINNYADVKFYNSAQFWRKNVIHIMQFF